MSGQVDLVLVPKGRAAPRGEVMITLPSAMHCTLSLSCAKEKGKCQNDLTPFGPDYLSISRNQGVGGGGHIVLPTPNYLGVDGVGVPILFFALFFSKLTNGKVKFCQQART